MFTPKTSHQIARELLALPDLPVECVAPDSGGYDCTDLGHITLIKVIDNEYIFIISEEIDTLENIYDCPIDTISSEWVPEYRKQTLIDKVRDGVYNKYGDEYSDPSA